MDEYLYNIDLQISNRKRLEFDDLQRILKNVKSYIEIDLDYEFVGGSVYPEVTNGHTN